MVSKGISGLGSRLYVNLLIELNILVPNLIGFEEKLYVKFFDPKDIYYLAISDYRITENASRTWL